MLWQLQTIHLNRQQNLLNNFTSQPSRCTKRLLSVPLWTTFGLVLLTHRNAMWELWKHNQMYCCLRVYFKRKLCPASYGLLHLKCLLRSPVGANKSERSIFLSALFKNGSLHSYHEILWKNVYDFFFESVSINIVPRFELLDIFDSIEMLAILPKLEQLYANRNSPLPWLQTYYKELAPD